MVGNSYNLIGLFFLDFDFIIFSTLEKINVGIYNSVDVSANKLNDSSLFEALKENTFWKFFLIYFFTAMGIFGISLQVVVYLIYCGFQI